MEQKKQFGVIFFLIDQERIEKVGHFYRKLRYSQMHSNPGATLKIPECIYKYIMFRVSEKSTMYKKNRFFFLLFFVHCTKCDDGLMYKYNVLVQKV